jgi:hypothetical protein
MQVAFASTDDPEARLLAMTGAYWDFAFRSPELYQVMYGLAGISFGRYGHPDTPVEVKQSFALAREAVQPWAEARGVESRDYRSGGSSPGADSWADYPGDGSPHCRGTGTHQAHFAGVNEDRQPFSVGSRAIRLTTKAVSKYVILSASEGSSGAKKPRVRSGAR